MAGSIIEKKEWDSPTVDTSPSVEHGGVEMISDKNEVARFFCSAGGARPMTLNDEKKLRRKIDWMIMPLMFGCYALQYLDKTLINYANVMGLQDDAGITGDQYSQLALIFYVSYLAFEFPQGFGMQRFPTAQYLGVMVVLWGLVVLLQTYYVWQNRRRDGVLERDGAVVDEGREFADRTDREMASFRYHL